jgi:hypothetical protein
MKMAIDWRISVLYLCCMFIKAADKKDRTTGRVYRYYKLCESYRIGDKTRHRTILVLGKLDEIQSDTDKKLLADRIEQHLAGSNALFSLDIPPHIDTLAKQFSSQIKRKGLASHTLVDPAVSTPRQKQKKDIHRVDLSSIEMEDVREIGIEWLCKQTLERLELREFLEGLGWSRFQVDMALIHIISRAAFPYSEHKTAQWIRNNSAVAELFNRDPSGINRFRLYRASMKLYQEKEGIEKFLSSRTNELFDIQDKIILYDLTNTYFEGRKARSKVARFGVSKEKRKDAKIVALALVVNVAGFVKYSHIYRGNIADCKTLEETLEGLSLSTSTTGRKPVVVIDAGIATEDNLRMLRSKQYQYICVSRTRLKEYTLSATGMVHLQDKREQTIDVSWVENDQDNDQYLYVRSHMKAVKESSMNDHFCDRYEEELDNVARAIHKKGGTKRYGKVMERIGRIKERYPTANKHYEIEVKQQDDITTEVTWKRKPIPANSKPGEGVYFIRTSLPLKDEKLVWDIYNTIRQIEEAFRVLKTDLSLRPVYHKEDPHTIAHLFLGIIAYTVVHTIRHRLKNHSIHHDWRNIVRIMNTQKAGTITMKRADEKRLNVRVCSRPIAEVEKIYDTMDYKQMPFYRKKFVFPESRNA